MSTWIGLAVGLFIGFNAAIIAFGYLKRRAERNDQGQRILNFVRRHGPTPLAEFTAEDGPELDAIVHQLHQQGDITTRTRAGVVLVFPNQRGDNDD